MSKDRLSIHQDSGGPFVQEAFSIMRDGGTAVQSGLIGVTNIGYIPGLEPVIPETIFNVQSSGASYIRFASGPSSPTNLCNDSSIQIFGNGNAKASGLQIKYKPYNDSATVGYCADENCEPPSIKYKQYSLQKCSDNSFVNAIDRYDFGPVIGSVVNYTDADGDSSCGTVLSFSFSPNDDGVSSINAQYDDCSECTSQPPPQTLYTLTVCGGVDGAERSVIDPSNFSPLIGDVVKYFDSVIGQTKCGTVSTISTGSSSASITADGYADCDACTTSGDDGTTVYEVTICAGEPGAGTAAYVTDDTNVGPSPSDVIRFGASNYCGTVVGTSSETATDSTIGSIVYDNCAACTGGGASDVTLYTIDRCDTGTDSIEDYYNVGVSVGNVVSYSDGTNNLCGTITGTTLGSANGAIFARYTDCTGCDGDTGGGGGPTPPPDGGGDPPNPPGDPGWPPGGGGTGGGEYIIEVIHTPVISTDPALECWEQCDQDARKVWWVAKGDFEPEEGDFVVVSGSQITLGGYPEDHEEYAVRVLGSGQYTNQLLFGNITGDDITGIRGGFCCGICGIEGAGGGGGFGFLPFSKALCSSYVNVGDYDKNIVDFSLIRPSGEEGIEFAHMSFTEKGYVGIGVTSINECAKFTACEPLTVAYVASGHLSSGTIAIHQQGAKPTLNGGFGKVYVKPYTDLGGSQALYFQDDSGEETNLLTTAEIDCCDIISEYEGPSGMVYGDTNLNTYAGWYTPKSRSLTTGIDRNTYYGQAAGFDLVGDNGSKDNTLVGFSAGSGAVLSSGMTIVGSNSFVNYQKGTYSVIIGYNNVKSSIFVPAEDTDGQPISGVIIGTNLFVNSDPPTGVLAIGHGLTPVVTGQLAGPDRTLAVDNAKFIVSTGDSTFNVNTTFTTDHFNVNLDARDETNTLNKAYENSININFSNAGDFVFNMAEFNPSGAERVNTPSYASQGFNYMQLNADLRLQGAIRFEDGSSLSGITNVDINMSATSGINRINSHYVLDYRELSLAGNVADEIRTDNTFIAVQVDGTDSSNMGKMSLQGLADYVSSGTSSIAENCNVIISNPENELDLNAAANSESVFIGCNVATNASGWKNSVIIGTEAGQNATTPNANLDIDTASVFIGYKAGRDCDNVDNTIAIGSNAGNEADGASDSIFIGSSAGINSSFKDSLAIGANALRDDNGIGSGNIEIVANMLDNQTLFSSAGTVDYKLNIQNVIAGDTDSRNVSIGSARLNAESPLEARYFSNVHSSNSNSYIQSWSCDDTVVGAVECDGSLSGFIIEGLLDGALAAPASISAETTATLSIYINGVDTTVNTTVTNRDPQFSASTSDYIIAMKIGGEYRPINPTDTGGIS